MDLTTKLFLYSSMSVSYTHLGAEGGLHGLDRFNQLFRLLHVQLNVKNINVREYLEQNALASVSYTHLDVYKRQEQMPEMEECVRK